MAQNEGPEFSPQCWKKKRWRGLESLFHRFFRNPRGLPCYSPVGVYKKLWRVFLLAMIALCYHWICWIVNPNGSVASTAFLVAAFWMTLNISHGINTHIWCMLTSKIHIKKALSLFFYTIVKYSNLYFSLKGRDILSCSKSWKQPPSKFYWDEGPLNFYGVCLSSSNLYILYYGI